MCECLNWLQMEGGINGGVAGSCLNQLHVVMLPWYGFGHIMAFVQMSNKFAAAGVKVTFISAPGHVPRICASLRSPADNPVRVVPVPIPPVDGLPPAIESTEDIRTFAMGELLKQAIEMMAPDIEALLAQLRPNAVLYDYCHDWVPDVARPLGIRPLFFSTVSAICSAYNISPARKPPGRPSPSVEDMRRPPPGLISAGELKTYEAQDNLFIFMEFGGPSLYDRSMKCIAGATAVVIRSCMEMEAPYIRYIEAEYGKPILLAGPVVPEPPAGELEPEWCGWLGRFPEKAVVYCALGSEVHLNKQQIRELSLGLEMTKMPFILVLNLPGEEEEGVGSGSRLRAALPEGFEERVKERGKVRTGWVQQQLILGHPSVGCFVTHVGFSSMVEALVHDCQLVLLPQRGDQFFNAVLVSRDMGAGVEVRRRDEDGYFGREDVCEAVEAVMGERAGEEEPGRTVRLNHKKWMKFFRDEEAHQRFVTSFVEKMKQIVVGI